MVQAGGARVRPMSRRLWLLLGALASTSAFADAYDFRIYQLGNPQVGANGYSDAANANFRAFARRIGQDLLNHDHPPEFEHSEYQEEKKRRNDSELNNRCSSSSSAGTAAFLRLIFRSRRK